MYFSTVIFFFLHLLFYIYAALLNCSIKWKETQTFNVIVTALIMFGELHKLPIIALTTNHSYSELCNSRSFLCFSNINVLNGCLQKSEKNWPGKNCMT